MFPVVELLFSKSPILAQLWIWRQKVRKSATVNEKGIKLNILDL